MSDKSPAKKRLPIVLFVAAFTLPVILAKLALEYDWFNLAATNKGQLLEPVLELAPITRQETPVWRVLYVLPEDCQASCDNALYSIQQIWQALGKYQDRAEATVIVTAQSDTSVSNELETNSAIHMLKSDKQTVKNLFKDVPTDGIFLIDTLGNAVLRYPLQEEQQQAVMNSRDILADLRKLMKLSRIG